MTARPADSQQPRVRRNNWSLLEAPALGSWRPSLPVSVIIPAHQGAATLPFVLAALAAQSYPSHLLEVLVADDGSQPPLELPEVRPENTRLLTVSGGWGKPMACEQAVLASEGEVIHWLDADMVLHRDHVEAQLRWHHLIDYAAVLGHKLYAEADALSAWSPERLCQAAETGALEELARGDLTPHEWVEVILARTKDLTRAGPRAMRVHVGMSASVRRDLLDTAGGMNLDMVLGEDIELGYRLRECGAVFIPDREARSLHLGSSNVMRRQDDVNRHNRPRLADWVPEFRRMRKPYPRAYAVPYVEVVLDATALSLEAASVVVDTLLGSTVPDVLVTLVADWGALHENRRSPLDDERLNLRLLREFYLTDTRVRRVEELPAGRSPATFRLTLPGPDYLPAGAALELLLKRMERTHEGTMLIELLDGQVARLDRTAAVERARLVARPAEAFDDVLAEVYGVTRTSAADAGFTACDPAVSTWPASTTDQPTGPPTTEPPAASVQRGSVRWLGRRRPHA